MKKKLICYALILSLLFQNGGQTVLAWSGKPAEKQVESNVEEEKKEPEILHEIEGKRGKFSKEYLLSDNSRTLVVYPQQIHYETEDGNLAEIDNSLIKTEVGYENGENSYDVLITDNDKSQGEVIFKEDKYEISWQMIERVDAKEPSKEVEVEENNSHKKNKKEHAQKERNKDNKKEKKNKKEFCKPELTATVTETTEEVPLLQEDKTIHQVEESKITFDGYSNGVSIEYAPTGDGIKENIILSSKESGNEYIFNVKLSGLNARLNTNNEIEFYDKDTDEIMYYFPAPFMIDNNGEVSYEAHYEFLTENEENNAEDTSEEAELEQNQEAESEEGTVSENESEPETEENTVSDNVPEAGISTVSGNETGEPEESTVSGNEIEAPEEETVSGNEVAEPKDETVSDNEADEPKEDSVSDNETEPEESTVLENEGVDETEIISSEQEEDGVNDGVKM